MFVITHYHCCVITVVVNLRPENEDPFMILIQELRVTLYGFTGEEQLKAWQLLCSQRGHSSAKKSEIALDYIKR